MRDTKRLASARYIGTLFSWLKCQFFWGASLYSAIKPLACNSTTCGRLNSNIVKDTIKMVSDT